MEKKYTHAELIKKIILRHVRHECGCHGARECASVIYVEFCEAENCKACLNEYGIHNHKQIEAI